MAAIPQSKPQSSVKPSTSVSEVTTAAPVVQSVTREPVVQEVAAVAAPVAAPVVLTTSKAPVAQAATEATTLETLYSRAVKAAQEEGVGATLMVERFKKSLDRYFTKMAPGQMLTPKEGAFEQYLLTESLIDFFKNENEAIHRLLWNYHMLSVVSTFGKNFEMMNRYLSDEWTYGKDRYDFFTSVNNLVMWTANPATRATNIKKIAEQYRFKGMYWTEAVQSNMSKFYGL